MKQQEVAALFEAVHEQSPLVHHMTNVVTINDCANATLAIGASPVMATSREEVEDMVQLADALVLNLGTTQVETFKAMLLAGKAANEKGIPVILDPVGVGATRFRNELAKELLQAVKVAVIRGNASEINALIGGKGETRGVDAGEIAATSEEIALQAAKRFSSVVAVSGEVDSISNGEDVVRIENGDRLLQKVTGTGCMTTSLIGSFAGVTNDYFLAATIGTSIMGVSGERAKYLLQEGEGMGTYKVRLMDEISNMNADILQEEVRFL